jgi:hypothetical protein
MKSNSKYGMKRKSWLTKSANGLLSTKTPKGGLSAILEPTLPEAYQYKDMCHHKCETLLYDSFIKILVNGDFQLLVIKGAPTKEDIALAWAEIMEEYSELIKTPKSINIFEAFKKCIYTYWKMCFIEAVIYKFRSKDPFTGLYLYDEKEAEQVMLLGYDMIDKPDEEEKYLYQIEMLDRESKTLVVLLNQYNQEYKQLAPKEENPIERTIVDYDKELAILSKFMGYWVDKKTRTVADVCGIINAFIEHQKIN